MQFYHLRVMALYSVLIELTRIEIEETVKELLKKKEY